ncbi:hypothetical protein MNBD_GAMMA10-2780 [hydrothermal vent metagenome]|uniref:Uncharacterized protein n=1 Tax=hydrothermal vent metagenome TaxID=652676 RepID=A0A3B0XJJ4_9ZZZZ
MPVIKVAWTIANDLTKLVILQNYCRQVNKNPSMKKHNMGKQLIYLIFLVKLLMGAMIQAATDEGQAVSAEKVASSRAITDVEIFVERAKQLKLAQRPGWLNLLHYKVTRTGELESQADDKRFYLAENGAADPQAELEADLRGFFSRQPAGHPQCLFPARLHWLNRQLNFGAQMPPIDCKKLNWWKKKFEVKQLTLLFPTMYLDNPASMFGHTFIRFDRDDGNLLLSQTLSYAAATGGNTDSFLVYSWKGIMGGYPGRFFINAYFETLQEYSDIEQRDIWEYTLNLNQREIAQLARHLWELRGIHFDYYFFRENCAYRLLSLLDVAREGINTSMNAHPLYAIPVDTVRDIQRAGLIAARHYRPSANSKIVQMSEQIDKQGRQLAFSVADKKISVEAIFQLPEGASAKNTQTEKSHPIESHPSKSHSHFSTPPHFSTGQGQTNRQLKILQLADEILNQKKIQGSETDDLQLALLSARSKLPAATQQQLFEFESVPPESAHQSARWQLSVGERAQQQFYALGLRPAFHDTLDTSQGFNNGASISLFDMRLRWYKEQEKLELEQLNLFSMRSLAPVAPWTTPLSRRISFKVKRREITPEQRISEFEAQFATGYTVGNKSLLGYAMLSAQFDYATALENNHGLYLGADAGVLWVHTAHGFSSALSWQAEIAYQNLQQLSGEPGDIQKLNIGVQFNLMRDHAIRFEYERTDYELFDVMQGKFSYLVYF